LPEFWFQYAGLQVLLVNLCPFQYEVNEKLRGLYMGKWKSIIAMPMLVVCLISFSGCSLIAPSTTKLSVTSQPPDADIFINGQFAGKGAGSITVPRNQPADILVKKEGFMPTAKTVNTKISTTGVLDIIGGFIFLLPFLGFLGAGSQDLDNHSVNVILVEK
jgi:hypothetical protein